MLSVVAVVVVAVVEKIKWKQLALLLLRPCITNFFLLRPYQNDYGK